MDRVYRSTVDGWLWLVITVGVPGCSGLHFCRRRAIFGIGGMEMGQDVALRVHIVPQEVDEQWPRKGTSCK